MHYYHPFLIKAGTLHITATMLCKTYKKIWTTLALTFQLLYFLNEQIGYKASTSSLNYFLQRDFRHLWRHTGSENEF